MEVDTLESSPPSLRTSGDAALAGLLVVALGLMWTIVIVVGEAVGWSPGIIYAGVTGSLVLVGLILLYWGVFHKARPRYYPLAYGTVPPVMAPPTTPCAKCGAQPVTGAVFCQGCGASLAAE